MGTYLSVWISFSIEIYLDEHIPHSRVTQRPSRITFKQINYTSIADCLPNTNAANRMFFVTAQGRRYP